MFSLCLTKQLILQHFSEEQIMEFYLKVPIQKGLFRSPLRKDKNPTCSFFRSNTGTLLFKDFATGQSLNVFDVVRTKYKCSLQQALRIIANDFDILPDTTLQKNEGVINEKPEVISKRSQTYLQAQIKQFTDNELEWWNSYGITKEILNIFQVYSCKFIYFNNTIVAQYHPKCPIYGYFGGFEKELELWRFYFPTRKNFRFLTNWPATKIQGINQLPFKHDVVVITKSMKDVMCLYSLGIPACAPNSETLFIPDKLVQQFKIRFKTIIVLYDNDRPGMLGMSKIRRKYPEFIYTKIPINSNAKDISDYYSLYGREQTLELVNTFKKWLRQQSK